MRFLFITAFILILSSVPVKAEHRINRIILPGFFHSTYNSDIIGVILPGKNNLHTSPVVAEIDGNTKNGKEIAVLSGETLSVISSRGKILWSQQLPKSDCASSGIHASSPAVGRLAGKKSKPAVVIGYGYPASPCDGGVVAYRGSNGSQIFNFNVKNYGRKQRRKGGGYSERFFPVISTPTLADTNNDGKLEIGFGSLARHIFLLNHKGKVLWYYQAADTVWSSPAFADLDNDNKLEMVIGTDISQNEHLVPPTPNGGYIYSLKTNLNEIYHKKGNLLVPFRAKSAINWYKASDQTILSSPVIADVHPKYVGKEIIIGSGYYFPEGEKDKLGKSVKVYKAKTGKLIAELPMESCTASSVAVADLDFDGINEIVTLVNASKNFGGDGNFYLSAWKANKSKFNLMWKTTITFRKGEDGNFFFNSPVIGDLDGNGSLEIVINVKNAVIILNGASGTELASTASVAKFTPAIADLNGDGVLDLIIRKDSSLIAYTNFHTWLDSDNPKDPSAAKYAVPWPQWRGDPQRQGAFIY